MGGRTEAITRAAGRRAGPVLVAVGAGGSTAALTFVYVGVRRVVSTGGYCSGGGAYAIAHRCDRAATLLLLVAIIGLLTFGGLLAAGTALLRGPMLGVGLWIGGALFGILGWNFITLGANPPNDGGGGAALIVAGAVFGLMAVGGLVPAVQM
jgi:hypothetical protein